MKSRSWFLFLSTNQPTVFVSLSIYALSVSTCEIDTVITAASSDYFDSLQNLVGSMHAHEPLMNTVVYDLGLDKDHIREINQWNRVRLASINLNLFPPHVRNLSNYAWKSCVIQHAAASLPCFLFLDAGMELRDTLADIKGKVSNHSNWFVTASNGRGFSSLAGVVHPGMCSGLGLVPGRGPPLSALPSLAAGMQAWTRDSDLWGDVFAPWLRCSMRAECIAPAGADGRNHRFDQSALSLILFNHILRAAAAAEGRPGPATPGLDAAVTGDATGVMTGAQRGVFVESSDRYWVSSSILPQAVAEGLLDPRARMGGVVFYARRRRRPKPFAALVRRRADGGGGGVER